MFKNLKSSDWIAAGIQGLTTFGTAALGNMLSDQPAPADPGVMSEESVDTSFRIFSNLDTENPNLDFTGNLVENLLSGGSARTGAPVGFDPALTFVENAAFTYGTENGLAGAAVERPATAPVEPVAPVDTPLPPIQVDLTPQPIETVPFESPMPTTSGPVGIGTVID